MKKWQRLEHHWETRSRTERGKTVGIAEEEAEGEDAFAEKQRIRGGLWQAYKHRLKSAEHYANYEKVSRALWAQLGENQPDIDFGIQYQKMVDRRPVDPDFFIDYLERDPRTFRSGYNKERIIQYLKNADLTESERIRLRNVALHVVDQPDRREFRRYCGLARAIDSADLRAALWARFADEDIGVRRRASWMLYGIGERSLELQAWQHWKRP